MTDIKKGDRVKVTLEGTLTSADHPDAFAMGRSQQRAIFSTQAKEYTVTIEKIEPPVEVFKPGDVVRVKRGLDGHARVLGQDSYIVIPSGRQWRYGEAGGYEREEFTSRRFERVNLS